MGIITLFYWTPLELSPLSNCIAYTVVTIHKCTGYVHIHISCVCHYVIRINRQSWIFSSSFSYFPDCLIKIEMSFWNGLKDEEGWGGRRRESESFLILKLSPFLDSLTHSLTHFVFTSWIIHFGMLVCHVHILSSLPA